MDNAALSSAIVEQVAAVDTSEVLQQVAIGAGNWRNELVLFLKPEVFLVADAAAMRRTVDLAFAKIAEFGAQVDGVAIVGGKVLDDLDIMSRHYGLINRLSRSASTSLDAADQQKIADGLGISLSNAQLLGGHEYLARYSSETPATLDRLWFEGKSTKIRSGFYVRAVEKDGEQLVLINAFHPAQLLHFTDPTHRIVLMLVHSDTDWSTLKNEMGGATFPEKASPRSIRGTCYADPATYGFEKVGIDNNLVHISAGPFEAMFEIYNFFGTTIGAQPSETPSLALRRMHEAGIGDVQALAALDNPPLTLNGKATDLFSATEDTDTEPAIELYRQSL